MAPEATTPVQDLASFGLPPGFRGRPAWFVQLWWLVQATLFAGSPQFMYGWRRFILRCFGAHIGKGVIMRPSVKITYPWKLHIDDYSWVGDQVVLYTLGPIHIGANTVVSQNSYICTGSHDEALPNFAIYAKPIAILAEAWVASDVFIAPGVTVGAGAVVGARSSVFHDVPEGMVVAGNPAKPLRPRRRH
jgi:putative colanic acid biosynthesis acetyltransferase WcaF